MAFFVFENYLVSGEFKGLVDGSDFYEPRPKCSPITLAKCLKFQRDFE